MTDETIASDRRRFPRWAIVLLALAGGFVVAVIAVVVALVVEVLSGPAWGPTAAADLQPGSCLAEADLASEVYTVVDCDTAYAQQVFAEIDLGRNTAQYTTISSLTSYAGEICNRFVEYGLFVSDDVDERFTAVPLSVPTPEAVASGNTRAVCSLVAVDGSTIIGDFYQEMP